MSSAADKPLVSIIVPVYNAAGYIRETIGQVQRQTVSDWELILTDDSSEDDSFRIMTEEALRDPRIKVLSCNGKSAASARNCGIDAASGRYIAFLDADDIWFPDKLEKELAFAETTGSPFVFTAYEFGDSDGNPTGKVVQVPSELDYTHALSRTVIFTSTVLLDREKLDDSLIRMPEIESEDTACWWTILKSGITARGLNEVLTIYRRPAGSLSSNKLRAIRRIWGLYRNIAGLSAASSVFHMAGWAVRATLRRL